MWKPKSLSLCLLILACAAPAQFADAYPGRALSAVQIAQDTEILRHALERIHPGYERFAEEGELAALWVDLDRLAKSGTTDLELLVEISRVLAAVRCDHTIAELPEDLATWREEERSYLPVRLEFIGDRAFVIAADPEQPMLAPGQELLAIDSRPLPAILADVRPLISVDGYTDHVKDLVLGFSSEYQGGALDHFRPLLEGFQDTFELTLGTTNGERSVEVQALTYGEWQTIASGKARYRNFKDEVEFRWLEDGSAYLSVATFVNYRDPVNPKRLFRPIFEQLEARGTERLILDLRENGGGSTEPALALLRYLMDKPFVWARPSRIKTIDVGELRPYLSTWDESAFKIDPDAVIDRGDWYEFKDEQRREAIKPYAGRFTGEVVVLVGPGISSGSNHLVAKLKDAERVTLVGGPTGGNPTGVTAGTILFLKLPNSGIVVRVPAVRTVLEVTGFVDGQPIEPDVLVPRTREALFDDVDRELAAALALE